LKRLAETALHRTRTALRGGTQRIYITGGSNGGVMTQFLVCNLADRIAGAGDAKKWDLPDLDPNDGCRIHAQRWEGKVPVLFETMEGHGHGWPMQKGRDETGTGPKTRDISAPEEFWKFFTLTLGGAREV
jgi:poly(3-hydroxybutyrate) depolymerase